MDKIAVLKTTPLFNPLSDTELRALAECCLEHRLSKGEVLFLEGDQAKGVFVIARGALKAFRESADGREQVIHVERAPATIAEIPVFDDQPYPSSVAAEEESLVYFIDKRDVKRLCLSHPAIALAALKLLAGRLRRCAALVETLSLKEVDQRLALFLLQEAKTHGSPFKSGLRYQLPPNTQVAARVGSVREVVSRALSKLQEHGLIDIDRNRQVTILDEKALRRYAEMRA
jgi:CRP/FNR family transcriptional regulator